MPDRNILITGIPRSGTTLLAALIDGMPDAVALNEPRWQYDWAMKNRANSAADDFARWLVGDHAVIRQRLLQGIPIPERRTQTGEASTNYYRPDPERPDIGKSIELVPFTRHGLSPDFTLAVKHNGLYLGALKQIVETGAFRVIAIVRHPVGVICSWNAIPIQLREGRMPGAVVYWQQMAALTTMPMDILEKQVHMYDLICHRLHSLREHIDILRYEDLIENPALLTALTGKAPAIAEGMIKKRDTAFYGDAAKATAHCVSTFAEHARIFYPEL